MIRRILTRILLLALLGFCGYNWFQVRSLQAQVDDLRVRVAAPALPPEGPSVWPASAARHANRSQLALTRSDWKSALRELQQGIEDLSQGAKPPKTRPALPVQRRSARPNRPHFVTTSP